MQDERKLIKNESLRILYIEDNINDFLLVQRLITAAETEDHEEILVENADRISKGLERLRPGDIDLVLTDLNLPDSHELEAVTQLRTHYPQLPIIVLTNAYTKKLGIEAVRKGAQDYLLKDELTSQIVWHSIRYSIERKRLEKLRDEFVSTVSHELITPLAIIKGGLDILIMGIAGPLTEKQQEILKSSSKNIDLLANIINNILDVSRLEYGHFTIKRHSIDLKVLLHDILEEFRKSLVGKTIVLEEHIPPIPNVFADGSAITQVMNNLLSNAERHAQSKIVISAQILDHEVTVRVSDDGPGISLEKQEKLFKKFEQIDRQVGGHGYKGTGLGLVIAKDIIDLHFGKIWVESEVGKGTQFCFTLPVY